MITLGRFRVWYAKRGSSDKLSSCRWLSKGFEPLEKRELLANWFVAPDGLATNPGTIEAPWDIQSALTNTADVDPGDTIWVRGGTYYHPDRSAYANGYVISLQGAPESPIMVRAYPGERATIDGGLHTDNGSATRHVRVQDLEIIVSENLTQSRYVTSGTLGTAGYAELNRPYGGVDVRGGHDLKFINNVVHANAQGFGFWKSVSGGSELYGNLIYDNGWDGPFDQCWGHPIYTQNNPDHWKYIRDNIVFDEYGWNLHAYGSSIAPLDKFVIERNIWSTGIKKDRVLVGGSNAPNELRFRDNVVYNINSYGVWIGYSTSAQGDDIVVTGNTLVKAGLYFRAQFTNVTNENNFEWRKGWSNPEFNGEEVAIPDTPMVVLNPNIYDPNRANLAIMAFQGQAEAEVDVGSFLEIGDMFRLMDPSDFFGEPLFVGAYAGNPVSIPITGEFTTYIVLKQAAATNIAPAATDDGPVITRQDTSITIHVLANDSDADGTVDPATVAVVAGADHGVATVNGNGTVAYAPAAKFFGTDRFRYTVQDDEGATSNVATVTIRVAAVGDTPGLYDPTAAAFHLKNANADRPAGADIAFRYGPMGAAWPALAGDWNGDGIDTVGLYDPNTAGFHLKNVNASPPVGADIAFIYGPQGKGWQPLVGDWNGDGVDTVGLYDPFQGTFHLKNTNRQGGGADITFRYGPTGQAWQALAGDWDGDGVDTVGLYDPATGGFHLKNSNTSGGGADAVFRFGPRENAGWQPLAGDWNQDGVDTVGVYDPNDGGFHLKNSNTSGGGAAAAFLYGPRRGSWQPLTGDWDGSAAAQLQAAGGQTASSDATPLAEADLRPIIAEAFSRWDTIAVRDDLSAVDFATADLPGSLLGLAERDRIFIDRDAAGYGWFVDPTPEGNEEFAAISPKGESVAIDPSAVDRMDLLTVVSHELGHLLGLEDLDPSVQSLMSGTLQPGTRREPTIAEIDRCFSLA